MKLIWLPADAHRHTAAAAAAAAAVVRSDRSSQHNATNIIKAWPVRRQTCTNELPD
jgi:hypothetical protein